MRKQQFEYHGLVGVVPVLALLSAICLASGVASAASLSITVSVADVVFDGTDIVDAGSPLFGSGDLAEADLLDTMVFRVDGTTVGTLTNPPDDLGVDIHIPSISAIPGTGGTGISAAGGTFDLITSSAVPGYGLELTLGPAEVIYAPLGSFVDFVFVGTVASVGAQDLPFDLDIGDPINVTLSLQALKSSVTFDEDGFLAGFEASGSGEVVGDFDFGQQEIPEPSTMLLGGLAMLLIGLGQARRNRN